MRQLNKGIALNVPERTVDKETGKVRSRYVTTPVCGWLVNMCFDYPAGGACLPFAESVASAKPCRSCDWNRLSKRPHAPASFVEKGPVGNVWKLRTLPGVNALP